MEKMRATVFHGVNDIRVEEVERPHAGVGEAVIRVTLTTIRGTDLHIVRGEYPVKRGLVIGHEPVGVIDELGAGVTGYKVGDRVLVGAITPCGQCPNREVCLQVEEFVDAANWKSVIATGKAELLTGQEEMEHAMQHITKANPTLTPALNKMGIDSWGRANNITLYRIRPDIISGRKTTGAGETQHSI